MKVWHWWSSADFVTIHDADLVSPDDLNNTIRYGVPMFDGSGVGTTHGTLSGDSSILFRMDSADGAAKPNNIEPPIGRLEAGAIFREDVEKCPMNWIDSMVRLLSWKRN